MKLGYSENLFLIIYSNVPKKYYDKMWSDLVYKISTNKL